MERLKALDASSSAYTGIEVAGKSIPDCQVAHEWDWVNGFCQTARQKGNYHMREIISLSVNEWHITGSICLKGRKDLSSGIIRPVERA